MKQRKFPDWFVDELANDRDKDRARNGSLKHDIKVTFVCKKHGCYEQNVSSHIYFRTLMPKQGCPVCGKIKQQILKKVTLDKRRPPYPEWFINELAHEEDKKKAKDKSLSTASYADFYCPEHGIYNQKVTNHICLTTGEKKRGCPTCSEIQRRKTFTETKKLKRPEYPQWFIDEIYSEENKKRAEQKDLKYNEKIEFICKVHGIYEQTVAEHIDFKTTNKKHGCPKCGINKQIIAKKKQNKGFPQWFIDDIANEYDKRRALLKELLVSEIIEFKCPVHGNYKQRVDAHICRTNDTPLQGCPSCGKIKKQITRKENDSKRRPSFPQWFVDELAHESDKERARNACISSTEYLDFYCFKHGIYKQYVGNHITISTGEPSCKCPHCKPSISCCEKEIYKYIKNFCKDAEERNRTTIRSIDTNRFLELDILCKNKNIAIEYNGSLWHGERFSKKNNYHINKKLACERQNIRLLSIFDKDWIKNKNKTKLFIKSLLKEKQTIHHTKVVIKKIDIEEANNFYDKYHLKGRTLSNAISYGLYHNNKLISAMSFSKFKEEWYISRHCIKFGYSVVDGTYRLFFQFIKEFNPNYVIAYTDCDYFTGHTYQSIGFDFEKMTRLPYYWAKDNKYVSTKECKLSQMIKRYPKLYLKSIEFNIEQKNKRDFIMHELGFYKVFRCGYKRLRWTKQ